MLTRAQVEHHHDRGYVLAGGIFTEAEMDELEAAFDRIVELRLRKRAPLEVLWAGDWRQQLGQQTPLFHTHDVQAYSAAWSRALLHDRFTAAMADLLGPNVQLHHTKLMQKPPEKGAGFPMHQDYPYFPHERHTMTACVVHLRDTPVEAGCLRVVPGSHRLGPLATYRQPGGGPQTEYLDPAVYPIDAGAPCPARRGEVLFFNYLTIHGSGLNRSPGVRKTVLVQVRDPADRQTGESHVSQARGLMLRGEDPLEAGHTARDTAEEAWQKAAG